VYLLAGRNPVLFEAGFSCMARFYQQDISEITGERNPGYLFLTHVHYDHCGAASYLKSVFPGLKICASERANKIMHSTNALQLMVSLSKNAVPLIAALPGINEDELMTKPFEPFDIDIIIREETTICIDNDTCVEVLLTPGHTRDMLSYYIPERKILFATESGGCLARNGHIVSEFLVDYDAYVTSLNRFLDLDITVFCQGHHFVFTGSSVKDFFTASLRAAKSFKGHVDELLDREGGSIERVVDIIKSEEYDSNPLLKQPEKAYLLNLWTQVARLAQRPSR